MKLAKTYINKNIIFYYKVNDEFIGKVVARTGKYEPFESKTILQNIKEGDQVGDIGANIGYYSLIMSEKVGLKGMVYAFEPEPESLFIFKKNILANRVHNIKIFPIALSSKKETKQLFLSTLNFGDHRLFKDKNEKITRHSIKIEANSLDNILKSEKTYRKIKLLKIDTQGYEPFVIEGAAHTIKKDKPLLFMEYWPYGYKRIKADEPKMIKFLNNVYGAMYMVDNRYGAIYPTNHNYIKNYCQQVNGSLFCDLLFKKLNYSKRIKYFVANKYKDYLNLPYRVGKQIKFGVNGNAYYYQKNGWSYPENDFNWTDGKISILQIPLNKRFKKLKLHLIARPLLSTKILYQKLIIYINNKKVFDKKIFNPDYQNYEINIPSESTKERNDLSITIHVPDTTSPYNIGISEDKRILGLAVKEIMIAGAE